MPRKEREQKTVTEAKEWDQSTLKPFDVLCIGMEDYT